jgi:hypothetical protein
MDAQTLESDWNNPVRLSGRRARWMVRGIQLCFLIIAAFQMRGPFLTAHNERQNQTFDIAQHVFQEGWSAILTPKASFSLPGYEARPFTVIRQEFPFHGLLGWPLVKCLGHEESVARLISIVFALLSIELVYLILQRFLAPATAVIGAALWGLSPLVLQFGQVPMPDILCTTGMLGAFWFALKSNLPASSTCFLFAILAKVSVIFFGLPILTALLVAKNCRTIGDGFRIAMWWGLAPLIGLLCWTALEVRDPDTPWTVVKLVSQRSGARNLLSAKFFVFLAGSLFCYGLGILGTIGCCAAAFKKEFAKVSPAILITLVVSNVIYFLVVVAKISEPQYILPPLAWLVMVAAFGLSRISVTLAGLGFRAAASAVVALHILVAFMFTSDLKASHVPAYNDIEDAAKLIPVHSRVIAAYPFYGASPAVWLRQNTYAVHSPGELEASLPQLQKDGFRYLILFNVESHSLGSHFGLVELARMGASLFHAGFSAGREQPATLTDYTATNAPLRQYCEQRFKPLFSTYYVVLYSLNN